MKTSDLPYILLNGGRIINDEARAWPTISNKCGLKKQGSVSCEVLLDLDMNLPLIDQQQQPYYVNLPPTSIGGRRISTNASDREDSISISNRSGLTISDRESFDQGTPIDDGKVVFRGSSDTQRVPEASQVFEICYDYKGRLEDELDLKEGDTIRLISSDTSELGWHMGEVNGKKGLFPNNYVRLLGNEPRVIPVDQISLCNGVNTLDDSDLLGSGAFAFVYRVKYKNKEIALKSLKLTKNIDALKREAAILTRLNHVNIVKLYGICIEAPFVGMLLELCEGTSLKSVVQKVETAYISLRILINWALQVASAMAHLVKHNLVHRDLKADNVLVKEKVCLCQLQSAASTPTSPHTYIALHDHIQADGYCSKCKGKAIDRLTLKITDFGVTRDVNDEKRKSLVGTNAYLAPEAYRYHNYSEGSDVWSFGVVMWELLTRQEPYKGMMPVTIAFQVSRYGKRLDVTDDCPLKWKEIMQSCWNNEPKERPTFKQLIQRLEEYYNELINTDFSLEEEAAQKIRTVLCRDINTVFERDMEQINEIYMNLYPGEKPIASSNHKANKPVVNERRGGIRITKQDIGAPESAYHVYSLRSEMTSPSSEGCFHVVEMDMKEMLGSGTLPRQGAKQMKGKKKLDNKLSSSSPNLHQIAPPTPSGGLRRKGAMKNRKHANNESFDRPTIETAPGVEDTMDRNHHHHYKDAMTPRKSEGAATIGSSSRKSEGEPHKTGIFHRIKKTLFHTDRDSSNSEKSSPSVADSDDIISRPTGPILGGSLGHSSSRVLFSTSTPRSNLFMNIPTSNHMSPRSKANSGSEDGFGKNTRHKISPADRKSTTPQFQPTTQTKTYVKQDDQPMGNAPILTRNSPLTIDSVVPFPHTSLDSPAITTHHRRTPSDDRAGGHHYQTLISPALSTVVPIPSTSSHYEHLHPGQPLDPEGIYVHFPYRPSNGSSNSAYIALGQAPPPPESTHTITNLHYVHCNNKKPERPATLNFGGVLTPESSGSSSAFSNLSLSESGSVPSIHAPPPPPTLPVIPIKPSRFIQNVQQ